MKSVEEIKALVERYEKQVKEFKAIENQYNQQGHDEVKEQSVTNAKFCFMMRDEYAIRKVMASEFVSELKKILED